MILNEEYGWSDVRYLISRSTSYDVALSFVGRAAKEQLPAGTVLYRLDFPVVMDIFAKPWWMKESAFRRIFQSGASNSTELRQEWQNSLALSKPGKGARTEITAIQLTQPVFSWVGLASSLFHKSGGEEQVYLPNLCRGTGPNRSDYARRLQTYTLPA